MLEIAGAQWGLAAAAAVVSVGCALLLRRRTRDREVWRYDPVAAWWRGLTYVTACVALAFAAGTVATILSNPLVLPGQTSSWLWWLVTGAVVAVVLVGYGVVWPWGTRPHGRRIVWPDTLLFGLLWGLGEALLLGTVWLLATRAWRAVLGTGALTDGLVVATVIVVLSAFIGSWHALYWDIHVSPEHNIIERNGIKVALVHTPNVVVATCWLTAWEDLGLFVLVQAFALTLSALAMPFPSFRCPLPVDPDGPVLGPPTRDLRDLSGSVVVVVGEGELASRSAAALAPLGGDVVRVPAAATSEATPVPAAVVVVAGDIAGEGDDVVAVLASGGRALAASGARVVVLTSAKQYLDRDAARRVGLVREAARRHPEVDVLAVTPTRRGFGVDLRYAAASPELDGVSGYHLAGRRPQQPALASLDDSTVAQWWATAAAGAEP